jgi:uncharacterized protein with gpF-like domain
VVKALDSIEDDWNALLTAAWASIGVTAGGWLYDDFDDTDAEEALLIAAILAALRDRAKGISDTTRQRLTAALDGADDPQAAIGGLYDHWTGEDDSEEESRSDSVAWDLTVGAWGAGMLLAGQQAEANGLSATRTWTTVGDDKVRDAHAEAEGQTISMSESYSVGGEDLQYPGDPSGSPANTYNCRCGEDYSIE